MVRPEPMTGKEVQRCSLFESGDCGAYQSQSLTAWYCAADRCGRPPPPTGWFTPPTGEKPPMAALDPTLTVGAIVRVRYTNWRGATWDRTVKILSPPVWTSTDWHPEPQWLVLVLDTDTNETRLFAVKDMRPIGA